jgi:hypothetical protein
MKDTLIAQTLLVAIGTVISALIFGRDSAVSYALGSSIILLNFRVIGWSWEKVIKKKSVAIAFVVIVFKYAILAGIIYGVSLIPGLKTLFFAVGLMTVVPAALLVALITKHKGTQ